MFRTTGVQSAKYIKKKRRKRILRTSLAVILVGLIVYGSMLLSEWNRLIIQGVKVVGNSVVSSEDIRGITSSLLEGDYFFMYPRKNIFLYPKRTIKAAVISSYKRIQDIKLSIDDSRSLLVTVEERKPFGLWCGDVIDDPDAQCSYLDDTAYIFEPAPAFSSDVYLKYYGTPVDLLQHTYLPLSEFRALTMVAENAKKLGLTVTGIAQINENDIELYISNTALATNASSTESSEHGTIFFNKEQSFDKTLANLQAFIIEYKDKNDGHLPPINYIDLRYGNNIVYKFR